MQQTGQQNEQVQEQIPAPIAPGPEVKQDPPKKEKRERKPWPLWRVIFSTTGFFWLTLLVFMSVSVTESGDFFNLAITHGAVFGLLGYAVAGTFDMLAIVFMMARLNATRIADGKGKWLALLGVAICAGISAFGNMASAVQAYNASVFNHLPAGVAGIAPYMSLVFPSMVVFTTLIADHIGDLNPGRADSIEVYRIKEMRKVELVKVRLEIERELAGVRLQMATLKQKPAKLSRKQRREQAQYEPQIRTLASEVEALKMLLAPVTEPNTDKIEQVSVQVVAEQSGQAQLPAPQNTLVNEKSGDGQSGAAVLFESKKDAVAAALQAHPGAPIEQIAAAAKCSVRTAQRWMSKLVQETPEPAEAAERPRLGMVEARMLEAFTSAPAPEQEALHAYAANHTIDELAGYLQEQYPAYASFITPERVSRVMDHIAATQEAEAHEQ